MASRKTKSPEARRITVKDVSSADAQGKTVEIGRGGVWQPAVAGSEIRNGDEIRTGTPGAAVIEDGDTWQVHYARAWRPGQFKRWYLRALQEHELVDQQLADHHQADIVCLSNALLVGLEPSPNSFRFEALSPSKSPRRSGSRFLRCSTANW